MRRKRLWYHCTQDDHGDQWTAERRPPRIMGSNEPPTPRLCVAPTLAGCFTASLFCRHGRSVQVYQTASPRSGIKPGRNLVNDCWLTREHWLVPPVQMVKVRVIPSEVAEIYTDRFREIAARCVDALSPTDKASMFLYAIDCLSLVDLKPNRLDRAMVRAIKSVWPEVAAC